MRTDTIFGKYIYALSARAPRQHDATWRPHLLSVGDGRGGPCHELYVREYEDRQRVGWLAAPRLRGCANSFCSPAVRRHVDHWVSLKVVRRVAELSRSLKELGFALLQVDRAAADHTQVKQTALLLAALGAMIVTIDHVTAEVA